MDLNNPQTKIFGRTIAEFSEELNGLEAALLKNAKAQRLECVNGQYLFPNLPYETALLDVQTTPEIVKNDKMYEEQKTVPAWWQYQIETGHVLLDLQMIYQIGRRLLHLEQTPNVQSCAHKLRKILDQQCISCQIKISYKGGLDAEIERRDIEGRRHIKQIQIPEFTKESPTDAHSYLRLAQNRPVNSAGGSFFIPENARPFLGALFGEGYEEAGAVFQYVFSPFRNSSPFNSAGDLPEVRLLVPSMDVRPIERAVVLSHCYRTLNHVNTINADDDINLNWPAVLAIKI